MNGSRDVTTQGIITGDRHISRVQCFHKQENLVYVSQ